MSQTPQPDPQNLLAALRTFLLGRSSPASTRLNDPANPGTISDAQADYWANSSSDIASVHGAVQQNLSDIHSAKTPWQKALAGLSAALDLPNTLGLQGLVATSHAPSIVRASRGAGTPTAGVPRSAMTDPLFREMLRRGVDPATAHDVLTQPNPYASAGAAIDQARATRLPPEPLPDGKPTFLREPRIPIRARGTSELGIPIPPCPTYRRGPDAPIPDKNGPFPPKTFPLFTDPAKHGLDFADPYVQKGGTARGQAAVGRTRPAIREGAEVPLNPPTVKTDMGKGGLQTTVTSDARRAIRSQDSHPESAKPPWSEQTAAFMQNSFYDEYTTTDPTTGERVSRMGADGLAAAYRVPSAESREGNRYSPTRFPVRYHVLPDGSQVFDAAANPAVQHSINMQAEQGQSHSLNLDAPLPPDLAQKLDLRSAGSSALAKGWSDLTTRLQRDPLFGDRLRSKLDATPAEWTAIMAARKTGLLPNVRAGVLMDLLSAILPGHDAGLQTMRAFGYTSGYGLHTRRTMGQPATRRPIIRSWPAPSE